MALVRVYCGLASADHARSNAVGKTLTVAVVDDSGRLLDVRDISDDPAGYAHLGIVLAERSAGPTNVAIATDSDQHLVTTLLTAAGSPLAFVVDDAVDDFAERFADDESIEEIESPPAQRRAIGLARALQAGALSAVAQPVPHGMAVLKPLLTAHAALAVGRQAAAVALREVLRELYPAALRAYPDPAEPVPLAVLDALPEPGLVNGAIAGRARDVASAADALAHQLAATGVGDAATVAAAITALRVAVAETSRRSGMGKELAAAVAHTVRQAVAAVRACDAASGALISTLAERVDPRGATFSGPTAPATRPAHAAPDTESWAGREATAEHARIRVPLQRSIGDTTPASAPPAAATSAPPATGAPLPVSPAPSAVPVASAPPGPGVTPPSWSDTQTSAPPAPSGHPFAPAAVSAPPFDGHRAGNVPPPPPGMTPMAPEPASSDGSRAVPPAAPFRTTVTITSTTEGDDLGFPPRRSTGANPPLPGSRANWPLANNDDDGSAAVGPATPDPVRSDAYADDPSTAYGDGPSPNGALPQSAADRVAPPWQADDLPPEPPMLRLVEPSPLTDPASHRFTDNLGQEDGSRRFETPPLRLVNTNGAGRNAHNDPSLATPHGGVAPVSVPPVEQEDGDEDLLIFAATRSAWFSGQTEDGDKAWGAADDGWRAAEQAARPSVATQTEAGLPKRVPRANLVPGSALGGRERPLKIVRDPASIAENTSGYFRGWRRGQQIGGYALGGRPGRESPHGWDSIRDSDEPEYDDGYQYRAAGGYHTR